MAQIVIDTDTKSKVLAVSIDGKPVDSVYGIHIYSKDTGFFEVSITQRELDDDNKLAKVTTYHSVSGVMTEKAEEKGVNEAVVARISAALKEQWTGK